MKNLFLICLGAVLLGTATVHAQDAQYRATLEKMMQVSGSLEAGSKVVAQIATYFKQNMPEVPEAYWDKFVAKWNMQAETLLVDIYVPIYQKYLTLEDLDAILAFYESPVGKKLAGSTPAITSEGMQAGQLLGQQLVQEVMQELSNEGYAPKE